MKNLLLLIVLTLSAQTFAEPKTLEFDENEEVKCHKQLKDLGCASDVHEDLNCVEKHKAKIEKSCKRIHETKWKNKSN
ncbi:MAG: hypothetical protein AB7I27_11735 [Bacteriovoracaceae bacterium]